MPTAPAPGRPSGRFPLLARAWPPSAGILLAAVLAAVAARPYRAFDTYFHLRFGEEFRNGWSLAHPGQLSTASSNDWAPTQWLSQVALARIVDTTGTTGLSTALAVTLVGFAAAVYLLLRRHLAPGRAVLLTGVVVLGSLPSLSARPQVLSYLMLVVVIASWDRARRTGRGPWWLIPLAWLWAMCHGMWVLGVAASLVLAVAVCLERRGGRRETLAIVSVPVAMLLAACLTPVGPRLVGAVVLVSSRAEHFAEWAAPELISLGAAPVTALLAAALVLGLRRGRLGVYDLALFGLGCGFAIYSQRTLPLAAVVLATVVARAIAAPRTEQRRTEWGVIAVLSMGVVLAAPALPLRDVPAAQVRPFADLLAALPEDTAVLTERDTGAVLLWTTPRLEVPIHGYGDVYTDAELSAYDDLARLEPGWAQVLDRLGAAVALLPHDSRLGAALNDSGWRVIRTSPELTYLERSEQR